MNHDPDGVLPNPAHRSPLDMSNLTSSQKRQLLVWARTAIMAALRGESLPDPKGIDQFVVPGCFVTLRRTDSGALCGCRGVLFQERPVTESVAKTAVAAALDDPRFPQVLEPEMKDIAVEISLLTEPAPIDPDSVEVGRHGLLIRANGRQGLLLPGVAVDYGWGSRAFLDAVCTKAGLPAGTWRRPGAEILGFETVSWHEPGWPERPAAGRAGAHGTTGREGE